MIALLTRKKKIISKRRFYLYTILYVLYIIVWLFIGYYIYFALNAKLIIKIILLLIWILGTPDAHTFCQSYDSYKKNSYIPDGPDFKKVRYMDGQKYMKGFIRLGIEIPIENIKQKMTTDEYFIIEIYKDEKIVVFKEPDREYYRECENGEWKDILKYIDGKIQ